MPLTSSTSKYDRRAQSTVTTRELHEFADIYLRWSPLSLALFRVAELHAIVRATYIRPVLDLGCGAGLWAQAVLVDPIDIGLDQSARALTRAYRTGLYDRLVHADARSMPLPDNGLQTVVSISVLEHVERPDEVLREVFRVLAPGGRFIATLVLSDIHRHLFYPSLLRSMRLDSLARAYCRCHDHVFRHRSLYDENAWRRWVCGAGFTIDQWGRSVNPRATSVFDRLTHLALFYRLGAAIGAPVVPRPRWWRQGWHQYFRSLIDAPNAEGSCLTMVVRKP